VDVHRGKAIGEHARRYSSASQRRKPQEKQNLLLLDLEHPAIRTMRRVSVV
jgi:hypothetical protein